MSGSWVEFGVAFGLFMASHMIPTRGNLKPRLVAVLGQRGFTVAYSLLSLVLLAWLIVAAGNAPFVALWDQALWQRWLVNLVMPLAVLLGVFGVASPNPLSFGGRKSGFDPDHPGVVGIARHPLLWAMVLWSGAHMLVNGDLAHVILFGSFLLFAGLGTKAIDRRNQRLMGQAVWEGLARNTSAFPFAAVLAGTQIGRPTFRSAVLLAIAAVIWLALLLLHQPVIGVAPLP